MWTMEDTITKAEANELREKLCALKKDFGEVAKCAKDRVVTGTTEWCKEHPAASIAIVAAVAAGIGLALGLMIGRNQKG